MVYVVRNLRFVLLGTGTSGGIPIIACECPTCTSDDPRDRRLRSGAAVMWTDPAGRERVVLIDATPDLREQALRHRLRRCDAILFTHNHVDHIFGLDEVRRFNAVMRAPIDVYAERATMDSLRRVYKHIFEKDGNVNDSFVATLIPRLIEPARPIDIHGMRFTPIRLLHGRLPIVGFRVEEKRQQGIEASWHRGMKDDGEAGDGASRRAAISRQPASGDGGAEGGTAAQVFPLAYCTDVSGIPTESWGLLEGLGTLVLDGLRIRHHPTHFNLDQAVDVALRVGARQTYLTHIAHEIRHAEVDAGLPQGINLAWDNLILGGGQEADSPEIARRGAEDAALEGAPDPRFEDV